MRIPIHDIDEAALPRDRSVIDEARLADLRASILASGLRQPIEVMALEGAPRPWGLVSGYRRLTVFRALHAETELDLFATIPATERRPADIPAALREMVEENAIRADITPWDEARIAVDTVPTVFETIDAAVAGLYASVSRQRRHKIRAAAEVVDRLGHLILEPENWSANRLAQVAAACRNGYADLIEDALAEIGKPSAARQWEEVFSPILREAAEEVLTRDAGTDTRREPRRLVRFRRDLTVRRVRNVDGWSLKFTGPESTGPLMEHILEEIVRNYSNQ